MTYWHLAKERLLVRYEKETATIRALASTRDGRYFAYGRNDGLLVLAHWPLGIEEIVHTAGQVILRWSGGSGLYQLQSTGDLAGGVWQNVGFPTTATAATNAVTGTVFYRVQSLPNQ